VSGGRGEGVEMEGKGWRRGILAVVGGEEGGRLIHLDPRCQAFPHTRHQARILRPSQIPRLAAATHILTFCAGQLRDDLLHVSLQSDERHKIRPRVPVPTLHEKNFQTRLAREGKGEETPDQTPDPHHQQSYGEGVTHAVEVGDEGDEEEGRPACQEEVNWEDGAPVCEGLVEAGGEEEEERDEKEEVGAGEEEERECPGLMGEVRRPGLFDAVCGEIFL